MTESLPDWSQLRRVQPGQTEYNTFIGIPPRPPQYIMSEDKIPEQTTTPEFHIVIVANHNSYTLEVLGVFEDLEHATALTKSIEYYRDSAYTVYLETCKLNQITTSK